MNPISIALVVLGLWFFFSTLFTVKQQTVAIIERFGRFKKQAGPGLNMKLPFIDRIAHRMNMRVQQLDVHVETKTKDDVFVTLQVSIQYCITRANVYDAYYKLTNAADQLNAYVFDVVRAQVPNMILDDVFAKKDEIALSIKDELDAIMTEFGYDILKSLVTDIEPDAKVKAAMNEINEATRKRIAATEIGEGDRILKVKAAEADAQSKALQGKGVADQRRAIIEGLQESVSEFQEAVAGSDAKDVMMLVLMTQYFDTLKEVAEHSNSNTIMIPSTPGGLSDLSEQIRTSLITANEITKDRT